MLHAHVWVLSPCPHRPRGRLKKERGTPGSGVYFRGALVKFLGEVWREPRVEGEKGGTPGLYPGTGRRAQTKTERKASVESSRRWVTSRYVVHGAKCASVCSPSVWSQLRWGCCAWSSRRRRGALRSSGGAGYSSFSSRVPLILLGAPQSFSRSTRASPWFRQGTDVLQCGIGFSPYPPSSGFGKEIQARLAIKGRI